jgi:glycosyltransferase involved in cell wall biosynthesis
MLADTAAIPATTLTGLLVKLQSPVSITLEKELFQRACRIVAVASSVADELHAYHIDPHQVGVLGNGVDTDVFTPPTPTQIPSTPYFLTAGRLAPRKGLEDLIECAAIVASHHPQVRFLVAGRGPFEKPLRALIARHRLEKTVILLGHISDRTKLVERYQGACAYIHPAHYEGLPTVILEAMACSKPVIATAVSGSLDVITDENNGLLVQPHSPEELAAAVMCLLKNPSLGHQLGIAALQTIRDRYTWAVVSRNYIYEYKNLVHG